MKKPARTPQEKKASSYEHDCRNEVAKSRSIARFAVAKRKQGAHQALRKEVNTQLSAGLRRVASYEDFDGHVEREGRRSWKKWPDAPLACHVEDRESYRASNGNPPPRIQSSLLRRAAVEARRKRGWSATRR